MLPNSSLTPPLFESPIVPPSVFAPTFAAPVTTALVMASSAPLVAPDAGLMPVPDDILARFGLVMPDVLAFDAPIDADMNFVPVPFDILDRFGLSGLNPSPAVLVPSPAWEVVGLGRTPPIITPAQVPAVQRTPPTITPVQVLTNSLT
jgi:hypothetical protein